MDYLKFIEKLLKLVNHPKWKFIFPVFSGFLLGIGFIFPYLGFLIWVAFLPLLFFLNLRNLSFKELFLAGFIVGFLFIAQVMSWAFDILPLSWFGIDNNFLSFILIIFPWLIFVGFLALIVSLFVLVCGIFRKRNYLDLLLIPSLWIIFEWIRSWAFGLFFIGNESLLGAHWTLGNLAYLLSSNSGARFLSSVGGIYLIGFLIILVNVLFFRLIINKNRISFLVFIFLILAIVVSYFSLTSITARKDDEKINVAVIQTKISSSISPSKEARQAKNYIQMQLLKSILQDSIDIDVIIFPEGSNFLKEEENKEYLNSVFIDKNVWIIDSGTNEERKFIGLLYNVKEKTSTEYEKRFLLPYGDYPPFVFEFIAGVINKNWLEKIKDQKGIRRGNKEPLLSFSEERNIGFLFCSEVISPNLHLNSVKEGSQLFFNAGSLSFSGGSEILNSQTLSMLQFRSAENGRYLVRSTNYGKSYIINNRGDVVKSTPNFENQFILGEIYLISHKTFYTKHGDWVLILAGILLLVFFILPSKFRD
ncbi:MAG: apolipoprotein N-acyltransferase [Candidatus Nealsonbacteria bacterium]